MKLILASNNISKIKEIRELLHGNYEVLTMTEAGIMTDIPEPFFTFEENALAKAQYVYRETGIPTFSEDSGLIVEALGGQPGVLSARYAGEAKNDSSNMNLLLKNMLDKEHRSAYYQTVVCYFDGLQTLYFKGVCKGEIAKKATGNGGFGYDPIFIPEGYTESFGVLPASVKKAVSHRAKAMLAFVEFLNSKL